MQGRFVELMDAAIAKNNPAATHTDKLAAATSAVLTLLLLSDATLDQQAQIARSLRSLLRTFLAEARDPQFDDLIKRNMEAFERDLTDLAASIKNRRG